jgi:hypothetical protein
VIWLVLFPFQEKIQWQTKSVLQCRFTR